jgi:hypothetical protein
MVAWRLITISLSATFIVVTTAIKLFVAAIGLLAAATVALQPAMRLLGRFVLYLFSGFGASSTAIIITAIKLQLVALALAVAFGLVNSVIGKLVAKLKEMFDTNYFVYFEEMVTTLKNLPILETFRGIFDNVKVYFTEVWAGISKRFMAAFESIVGIGKEGFAKLKEAFEAGDLEAVTTTLTETLKGIWEQLMIYLKDEWDILLLEIERLWLITKGKLTDWHTQGKEALTDALVPMFLSQEEIDRAERLGNFGAIREAMETGKREFGAEAREKDLKAIDKQIKAIQDLRNETQEYFKDATEEDIFGGERVNWTKTQIKQYEAMQKALEKIRAIKPRKKEESTVIGPDVETETDVKTRSLMDQLKRQFGSSQPGTPGAPATGTRSLPSALDLTSIAGLQQAWDNSRNSVFGSMDGHLANIDRRTQNFFDRFGRDFTFRGTPSSTMGKGFELPFPLVRNEEDAKRLGIGSDDIKFEVSLVD